MPNWTFMALHFFHTMALVLWVGGTVAIGAIVAPVAFRESPDRALAGRIVGYSLRRFDRVVIACIISLGVTSILMAQLYGRWSAWYAIQYACIVMMSVSALATITVVSPHLQRLRGALEQGADAEDRARFDRLHQLATLSAQFNLACGTVAVLFS
jgi:uncharacterized membrane protein